MNKTRKSILNKDNAYRGDGSKRKSEKLVFLSGLDKDGTRFKAKSNFNKVTTNKYLISNQERIILRDSMIKLGLLKMDNNRLLNEIERMKKENESLIK